jgi:cytochrome c oxidase cbb3-type subunit III
LLAVVQPPALKVAAMNEAIHDDQQVPLLEHSYDDIYELDNPMPRWMAIIMVGSLVFSIGYVYYYHFGPGKSVATIYNEDHVAYETQRKAREAQENAGAGEAVLAANSKDQAALDRGAAVFASKCVACHAAKGEGLVGPNLTDLFQKNGSSRQDLFNVIRNGVDNTAMASWSGQLSAEEVLAVTGFVVSLRGQNLAGKGAEGDAVKPFVE